jgi:very-short-patch-repair endonuclease
LTPTGPAASPGRTSFASAGVTAFPRPEANQQVGHYTVDFLWPEQRLVVEMDGWSAHRGRQAFEDDHERDLFLGAHGYSVSRFTPRQLERDAAAVAAAVRAALR